MDVKMTPMEAFAEHQEHAGRPGVDKDGIKDLISNIEALDLASAEYRAVERRIVRKLDCTLIPLLLLLYFCNYLDRNNIA